MAQLLTTQYKTTDSIATKCETGIDAGMLARINEISGTDGFSPHYNGHPWAVSEELLILGPNDPLTSLCQGEDLFPGAV